MTQTLPLLVPVKRQCGGTCWLNSRLTALEFSIAAATGQPLQVSVDYFNLMMLRDRFLSYLEDASAGRAPNLTGATPQYFYDLVGRVGLVPASAWSLNLSVREWKAFANDVEFKARSLRDTLQASAPDKRPELLSSAARLFDIFARDRLGSSPPASFRHNDVAYTPQSYYASLPQLARLPTLTLIPDYRPRRRVAGSATPRRQEEVSEDVLMAAITAHIDAGQAPVAGLEWSRKLLPVDGMLHAEVGRPGSEAREHGRHAVVVTGYLLGVSGEIVALQLRNSWGTTHGRDGFDVIDWPTFWGALRYLEIR